MLEVYFPLADVHLAWPVLIFLGFAVGTLQGFFGVGGGWLTTPSLNILGFPIIYAIGTDLAFTAGSAAMGSFHHYRLGNLELKLAAVLGLSGMAGMEGARRMVLFLEEIGLAESSVRGAYILLLFGVGLSIVIDYVRGRSQRSVKKRGVEEDESVTRLSRRIRAFALPPRIRLARTPMTLSIWLLVGIGLMVGILAGFLGTGGGFIMVPVLVYLIGVPTRVAVASSLFAILITNSYGAAAYGLSGLVEIVAAGLMLLAAVAGTQVGATATVYVQSASMRGLLGGTLLLAGSAVLLRQLELDLAATVAMFFTAFVLMLVIVGLLVRGIFRTRLDARQT